MFGEDEGALVAVPNGHNARQIVDAVADMDNEIMIVIFCHIDFTESYFTGIGMDIVNVVA